jgi:hypothetical protein
MTTGKLLCRLGRHDFVDFPDPNPETYGQREAQGYRACTRCAKTKDGNVYLPRTESLKSKSWWWA